MLHIPYSKFDLPVDAVLQFDTDWSGKTSVPKLSVTKNLDPSVTANSVIHVNLPVFDNRKHLDEFLTDTYEQVYRFANSHNISSVMLTPFYSNDPNEPLDVVFDCMRAASIVAKKYPDFGIAISLDGKTEQRLKDTVPVSVVKGPTSATLDTIEKAYRRPIDNFDLEQMIVQNVVIEDDLYRRLDRINRKTAPQLLAKRLEELGIKKAVVYDQISNIFGKQTVYNALDSTYEGHLEKRTIIYVALALRMDASDTLEVLEVAGYTFSKNDQLDIVYAYALDHQYNFERLRDVLEAMKLLQFERKTKLRDDIPFTPKTSE